MQRIDYNEACDGKDECDRKFSLIKRAMRNYRDEGHDILNAIDMTDAILNRCTNQKIKCQVIKIDSPKTNLSNFTKIPGITNIHSVQIEPNKAIRVWHYFQIGVGCFIETKTVEYTSGVEIVREFKSVNILHQNIVTPNHSTCANLFVCDTCELTFNDELLYEKHVMHELSATESSWDQTIKIYTNHANSLKENTLVSTSSANNVQVRSEEYEEIFQRSWATKHVKRARFTHNQKYFLQNCFKKGEKSGKSF